MAKIIYKERHEGENRLESIEGIEIEMLNGQKALIYPKYGERALLTEDKVASWGAKPLTEIEALKKRDNIQDTAELFELKSPAANYISVWSEKYGLFGLPTLLAAIEIQDQKDDIDALAETIEGADLLRDFTIVVWSCSRFGSDVDWVAGGYIGSAGVAYLHSQYLCVPTILINE